MTEDREVLFAAAGTQDLLSTDDLTGRKSLLAGAVDFDTVVTFMIQATTTAVDYEILSGSRTVARGRISTGGTIGLMPTPTTAAQKSFLCLAGEELTAPVTNATGTPSVMMIIDREAA